MTNWYRDTPRRRRAAAKRRGSWESMENGGDGEVVEVVKQVKKVGEKAKEPETAKRAVHAGIKEWLEEHVEINDMSEDERKMFYLLSEVDDWWTYEATKERAANEAEGLKETLKAMQQSIEKLEKKVSSKPTYAAALQGGGANGGGVAKIQKPMEARAMEEKRKLKTLVVSIADPKEKDQIRLEHSKDILAKAGRAMGEDSMPAGVRKLPTGDLIFQMVTEEDKAKWETHTGWAAAIAPSATVKKRSFKVMVHGVRVANINTDRQAEAIESLTAQNSRIHKNLRITRVSWLTSAIKNKKVVSSLIIETPCASMANEIIQLGLIEDHELKLCELFDVRGRPVQCFRCYGYGHFAASCRNATKCGHCAGAHKTDSCGSNEVKCAGCGKEGHKAWSRECPVRKDNIARKAVESAGRPLLYEAAPKASTPLPFTTRQGGKGTSAAIARQPGPARGSTPALSAEASNTSGGINDEWKTAIQGRASGLPDKRIYTKTKITGRQKAIEIDEEL